MGAGSNEWNVEDYDDNHSFVYDEETGQWAVDYRRRRFRPVKN